MLLLTDVPEIISFYEVIYSLQYSESYAGDVFMMSSDEPYHMLESAPNKIFVTLAINYDQQLTDLACLARQGDKMI